MDTTDPNIVFDTAGVCNHCHTFDEETSKQWFPGDEGKKRLETILHKIRQASRGKEYDCIIGLSGGLDSSFLALMLKQYDLKPLVVHVDAGWNSELAVYNIEKIVKYCNYELFTHVMDWEDMKGLQLSYLKAGVANQDVPQDHAFFASMYHFAAQHNISYVISGGTIASECVFPKAWHHAAMDSINLHAIHQRFGQTKLRHYKTISVWEYYFYYPFVKKIKVIRPLNFMPYNKLDALAELKTKIGYKEYGRKHGESRFTRFFQNFYLPTKFQMDKRRPHLSSLILSGQIMRQQALSEISEPLYSNDELVEDKAYIAKKLGISENDLDLLIKGPGTPYSAFDNWDRWYKLIKFCQRLSEKLLGRYVRNYG